MSNESRMMFASIAEDHARSDHEALADTAMSVTEQLEAAKQRELELLAVIEKQKALLDLASGSLGAFCADMGWGMSDMCTMDAIDSYLVNNTEPSQALREHEAKVLEAAAIKIENTVDPDTNDDWLQGYRSGKEKSADELRRMAEERRKK